MTSRKTLLKRKANCSLVEKDKLSLVFNWLIRPYHFSLLSSSLFIVDQPVPRSLNGYCNEGNCLSMGESSSQNEKNLLQGERKAVCLKLICNSLQVRASDTGSEGLGFNIQSH